MNNRHFSDFRRMWLYNAYLALLDVSSSQRGQLQLTIISKTNYCVMYSKSKLIIDNTALLTKTFFVFTVKTLKLHYILSYGKYSKYSRTNNETESSEIAS